MAVFKYMCNTNFFQILSKGLIVKVGSVFLRRKTKTLRITLRANMAPSSRCVVYWTREDGEVIADSVQFNVDGMFENKVCYRLFCGKDKPIKAQVFLFFNDIQNIISLWKTIKTVQISQIEISFIYLSKWYI